MPGMALMTCRECSGDVAFEAKACPHCGARSPAPEDRVTRAIAIAALIGIILAIVVWQSAT